MQNFTLNDTTIDIKEYAHHRVLTLKDIDKLHNLSHGTAYKIFTKYKKYFKPNEDYILLKRDSIQPSIHNIGFENMTIGRGMYILTLSGYLLIAKSITDDTAYAATREIISEYFTNIASDKNFSNDIESDDKYITVKEFVKQTGYSPHWVYQLVKRDEFKDFIKIIDGKIMLHICGLGIHKHNQRHRKAYTKPRFVDYVPMSQVHTANEHIGIALSDITNSLAAIANRLERFEREFDNLAANSQFEILESTNQPQPNRSWISKLFFKH